MPPPMIRDVTQLDNRTPPTSVSLRDTWKADQLLRNRIDSYCQFCGPLEAYEVATHDDLCEATRSVRAWGSESWPDIPGTCDSPDMESWPQAPWRVRLALWRMRVRIWWKAGRWRPDTFKEARRVLAARRHQRP